jgi:hypothetical protein
MNRPARVVLIATLLAGGVSMTATSARADFHLMKIREVLPGASGNSQEEFVELQMYSSGQTNISGHDLILYGPTGSVTETFSITSDVSNGTNQATILFASSTAVVGGQTPDYFIPGDDLSASAGAVCFDDIDCVSYGTFPAGNASDQDGGPGTPAAAPPAGQSITRRIDPGCATLLQDSDDTNNSATDFQVTSTPTPRNNSTAPTETACAGGGGGGQGDPNVAVNNLKTKTPGNKAIISGQIVPADPGGKVKLTLFANGSPLRKIAKKADTLDADSKFKKKFRVPSDSTRCKVTVKYNGQEEEKKKFRC